MNRHEQSLLTERRQCSRGHWTSLRLVLLPDLRTQVLAPGQCCATCGERLTASRITFPEGTSDVSTR